MLRLESALVLPAFCTVKVLSICWLKAMLVDTFLILEDAEMFPYEATATMDMGSSIEVYFLTLTGRLEGLLWI